MDAEPRPIISDTEIAAYITEGKPLPEGWIEKLQTTSSKLCHRMAELDLIGDRGTQFQIRLRQSTIDPLAFSAMLFALDVHGLRRFCLRRYNGKGHGHRNLIERGRLAPGFHIHSATERYQLAGFDEDAFAEATDRYSNLAQAVECLMKDCACRDESAEPRLF